MDIELAGVRAEREGGFTLDIPSLRVRGARITAILGPNGSGKTTLLRLIAGLERPLTGHVHMGGAPVRPGEHVAYVFQEQVFLRGSVRDNLDLGLRLRGVSAAERRTRVAESAALLGVAGLLDRRADRLSGGEGRRVGLARALCLRAPVLLLDEPLEGLDDRTYSRLLDELPQLFAAFPATTILVTHDPREAFRLAEDLVVVVGGRVQAAGEKHEVARNPRSAEVAEVLGYFVVPLGGRRVGVPPGALGMGPGPLELSMMVEAILDLVDGRELVGRIGDARVRVGVSDAARAPSPGDIIRVHADRFHELTP